MGGHNSRGVLVIAKEGIRKSRGGFVLAREGVRYSRGTEFFGSVVACVRVAMDTSIHWLMVVWLLTPTTVWHLLLSSFFWNKCTGNMLFLSRHGIVCRIGNEKQKKRQDKLGENTSIEVRTLKS